MVLLITVLSLMVEHTNNTLLYYTGSNMNHDESYNESYLGIHWHRRYFRRNSPEILDDMVDFCNILDQIFQLYDRRNNLETVW